jgi:hypothetical protein
MELTMQYYTFFAKYIQNLKPDVLHQNVSCVFHEETTGSLSIDLEKGLFFCHGCKKGGDIYSWIMHFEKCSFLEAKVKVLGNVKASVLSQAEVDEAHNYLLNKKHLQDLLFQHRGWLLDTIIRFKLGWNDYEKRVQIPIYNDKKQLINIRKYLVVGHVTDGKPKFMGVKGHNENYFFPIENLVSTDPSLSKFIFLCAGEPDTILACQSGFNAGTFTSGEGSFNRDLLPLFSGKIVYICYDKDLA